MFRKETSIDKLIVSKYEELELAIQSQKIFIDNIKDFSMNKPERTDIVDYHVRAIGEKAQEVAKLITELQLLSSMGQIVLYAKKDSN